MTKEEEFKRRLELEKITPHGCYTFNYGGWFAMTGRDGAIDFQIAMEKEVEKLHNDNKENKR